MVADNTPSTALPVSDSRDERLLASLAHLLALVSMFVGPLVLWYVKRNESDFVRRAALQSVAWQVGMVVAALLANFTFPFHGGILHGFVAIANIVLIVIAAVKAYEGKAYRYPVTGRFVS